MASETEKRRQTWDRSQFVALMGEITSRSMPEITGVSYQGYVVDKTNKTFHFRFSAHPTGESSKEMTLIVPILKGAEEWHPIIYNLPLKLHTADQKPSKASVQRLVDACDRTRVNGFARMDDNLIFSIDRVKDYLAGKRDWNSVYTHSIQK